MSALVVTSDPGHLRLDGEVGADDVAALHAVAAPAPGELVLDLEDLELLDGIAVAAAVDLVRRLSVGRRLVVRGAPQMLAHTLYKVGDLGGSVVLDAPRADEGTTAN